MGFLSSIGKMFSAAPPEQRQKRRRPTGSSVPAMAGAGSDAAGVVDQASALREQLQREKASEPKPRRETRPAPTDTVISLEPDVHDHADTIERVTAQAPAPRNKQELFEELQRNYRDVVDLVKKVDAHLDRNEQRSQEMLSIAQRIDTTLPALERFPEQMREQLDELKTEVVQAITASSDKSDARGAQIQQTLSTIGERIDHTSASHTQLVSTMAGFRETLGELAAHSARTGSVLESIDSRRQEREDELTKMLIASRRWSVTTLAVTLLGVSVAVAIAIIALVMQG